MNTNLVLARTHKLGKLQAMENPFKICKEICICVVKSRNKLSLDPTCRLGHANKTYL